MATQWLKEWNSYSERAIFKSWDLLSEEVKAGVGYDRPLQNHETTD